MTKPKDKKLDDKQDFSVILEEGIREILEAKKGVSPELRLQAIKVGADLLLKTHKVSGKDETGSFYN